MPTLHRLALPNRSAVSRLIELDATGDSTFVDRLRTIWDGGDAALPIDPRLPPAARERLREAMRVGDEVAFGDALVVPTSGSTGEPKGVVLTHEAIAASAAATNARLGATSDSRWLACLPLAHVGGLSVVTRAAIGGIDLVVHDGFDADRVTRAAHDGATHVSLVATALRRIDPSLFEVILLGGSRPPTDRPTNAIATYGMTETGSGVVYDGRPLDGVEIDLDAEGRIRLRCPMLLRSYRNGTVPFDAEGWFDTGDLGRWLADGRLHVEGRAGDLIITGGENVWPEAVEQALSTHPDVAGVMVRGIDDPEWGQLVEAVVVPSPGATPTLESLRAHVKLSHPAYLAPRSLVLTDEIPTTALGKPRRHAADFGVRHQE